ncbi:MAG: GNAT family N-acetyltransferase [Verrucomicrobiota bacterium]|nr:GNAT family N-acetyltransferase [Verrucomicrobiota bacterium]
MPVVHVIADEQINECWPVMRQLRPHLKESEFCGLVKRQMSEGYRLSYVREEGNVMAVTGYRILHNLAWGRFCYVDDLITAEEHRSKGHGAELLRYLRKFCVEQRCERLELDSGVQRKDAHRFYLREGMEISSHHFSQRIQPGTTG